MAGSRKRKEVRPKTKRAATATAKKKKTPAPTDHPDDGPSRCGYVDSETGVACPIPTLRGTRCGVHAKADRETAETVEIKTGGGDAAAASDVSVKTDTTSGGGGGAAVVAADDDDEVQVVDKPPPGAAADDDAAPAAIVQTTTGARARRERVALPEKAARRIELPNAPAPDAPQLKPAFRVECLTVPVASVPSAPPPPPPPAPPPPPPAPLVASSATTLASTTAGGGSGSGGGGAARKRGASTRSRGPAVEPSPPPLPPPPPPPLAAAAATARPPNALASLIASEQPRMLSPAAVATPSGAVTAGPRKVAARVGGPASARLAAGNRGRVAPRNRGGDDESDRDADDEILSSGDDRDDRFRSNRKTATTAKRKGREKKNAGDGKAKAKAAASSRKSATRSPRRLDDDDGIGVGAAKKRRRKREDEEEGEVAAAAVPDGSTTPVRARRQSRSPPSQRAQPLSRTGLAILRGLEPGVRHICGDHAPSYHVVELLDAADREPTSAVAQAVATCNLPHLALWQQINSQTMFGRRDLMRAAASDNYAIREQYKERDEEAEPHVGAIGFKPDKSRIVPCTDASRATPLLQHRLLHAHFSCAKGPSRYWCVRMRGDRCVYDTFWHDAGADGSAIADLLRPSAATPDVDGVAHPLESRYTMLTDVSVPAFPWAALVQHPARFVYHQKHASLLTHVSRLDPVTLKLAPSPPDSAGFVHALSLLSSSSSSSSSAPSSSSSPTTLVAPTDASASSAPVSVPREKRRGVGGGDGCVEDGADDDDAGGPPRARQKDGGGGSDGNEKSASAAVTPAWSSALAGKRETTVSEYRAQVTAIVTEDRDRDRTISRAYARLMLEATPLALLRLGSSYDESRVLRTEYPWPNPLRVASLDQPLTSTPSSLSVSVTSSASAPPPPPLSSSSLTPLASAASPPLVNLRSLPLLPSATTVPPPPDSAAR